jgi:hypothetical protein
LARRAQGFKANLAEVFQRRAQEFKVLRSRSTLRHQLHLPRPLQQELQAQALLRDITKSAAASATE